MKRKRKLLGFMVMVLCFLSLSLTAFAADTTMKNKKWVTGQGGAYEKDETGYVSYESNGTSYYKIKVPKQGYIIVDVKTSELPGKDEYDAQDDEYDGDSGVTNVDLLNSSKKTLSENSNVLNGKNNFSFSWAVKKGTYYLAVNGDQQYKIRYSFTQVQKVSKAGKNPKSAVSLKKGATVKNLLFPNQAHYYKIDLPAKSKVTLSFNSKIKEVDNLGMALTMQVAVKNGKSYKLVDEKGKLASKDESVWWEIKGKDKVVLNFPAGTYYIKMNGTGSGYYTMKWN